jgi:hypothetical protein
MGSIREGVTVATAPLPQSSLAGEKIYYDRGTVLRQMGVFHEPDTILGGVTTLVTHPVSIARAVVRSVLKRSAE